MVMILSVAGRALLMQREGVRLKAYRDVKGIWTIGVGHTSMAGAPHVWPWSKLTMTEAIDLFAKDVHPYEAVVELKLHHPISQNAFDACVSLCYNIGPGGFAGSSVLKMINAGDMQMAANDFLLFNHPPALLDRRRAERQQFLRV